MEIIIEKRIIGTNGYEKMLTVIKSESDLLMWINSNVAGVDKYIAIGSNIMKSIANIDKITHKKFKTLIKRSSNGNCYRSTIEYWLNRGYNEADAKAKVSDTQSNAGKEYAKLRKDNPSQYTDVSPNQISYWTKKGYSVEDAILLVKERQSTFSLEKCISKYGKAEGLKRFEERQAKWQSSRNASLKEGKWSTSSQASDRPYNKIENLIEDFGNNWIDEHIIRCSKLSKEGKRRLEILSALVKSGSNIKEFIASLEFSELLKYSKTKVIKHLIDHKCAIEIWCESNGTKFKRNSFGNQYWHKGYYLKSDGELKIAIWLLDNGIDFNANGNYPNSRKAFDYYLPEYDLYVELAGMKNHNYETKLSFLRDVPYNILWIKSLNDLTQYLDEKNNQH